LGKNAHWVAASTKMAGSKKIGQHKMAIDQKWLVGHGACLHGRT
jgi:hypothetical protein